MRSIVVGSAAEAMAEKFDREMMAWAPGSINKAEARILSAIAWWRSAGIEQPSRHQVAFVAGYTVNGHFNNTCGTLRTKGLLDYPTGGALSITPTGLGHVTVEDGAPSFMELCNRVRQVLKGEPHRRVFDVLVNGKAADGSSTFVRADLARRAGYTENGHFNNIVGELNSLGVICYPAKGSVALGPMFNGVQ